MLAKRVPDGPGSTATVEEWKKFLKQESKYLFFTETGGYVWLVDALVRRRKLPIASLRGPLEPCPSTSRGEWELVSRED